MVWCLVVGAVVGGVVGFVLGRWLYIDVMPAKVCMEIDCPAEVETLVVGEAFVTIIDDPVTRPRITSEVDDDHPRLDRLSPQEWQTDVDRPNPTRVVDEREMHDECHWCHEQIVKHRGQVWVHVDTVSISDSRGGFHDAEPRRV